MARWAAIVRILSVFWVSVGVGACSEDGRLEGKVLNNFGGGLPGVEVSIPGSKLTTTTDEDGLYELTYVPGRFSVVYRRDGLTSQSLQFDLSEETQYPVADVVLWLIPPAPEVFYAKDGAPPGYIPLTPFRMIVSKKRLGRTNALGSSPGSVWNFSLVGKYDRIPKQYQHDDGRACWRPISSFRRWDIERPTAITRSDAMGRWNRCCFVH